MGRRKSPKSDGGRKKRRLKRHDIEDRRYRAVIRRAKDLARSELAKLNGGWTYQKYAERFSLDDLRAEDPNEIERVDARKISVEDFRSRFESGIGKPVILLHAQDSWLANERWTVERLAEKYRNQLFKVGEDDDGTSVKIKFKYYAKYMRSTSDDSPLYIFDSRFGEHRKKKKLLEDYEIPPMFQDDLLRYSGERKRPPHRWIVIGPPRSGTGIHIDPMGTAAWNSLVRGTKRWVLIPPGAPRDLVKPKRNEAWRNRGEAIAWFEHVYPRTLQSDWPEMYKPVNFVQHSGETVFVPSGWWHVVLNLDETIAVTQNFASPGNFSGVFASAVKSRPILARKWLKALRITRPEIASVAEKIYSERNSLTQFLPGGYASSSSSGSSSSSDSYASSVDTSSDSPWSSSSSTSSSNSRSRSRSPVYRKPTSNASSRYRSRSRSPIRSSSGSAKRSHHHYGHGR